MSKSSLKYIVGIFECLKPVFRTIWTATYRWRF